MSRADHPSNIDIATDPAFADYNAQNAKLHDLHAKQVPLKRREEELAAAIRTAVRSPQHDGLTAAEHRQVQELLGLTAAVGQDEAELRAELQSVRDELRIVNLAVEKQRQRTEAARIAGAKATRERLLPLHQEFARNIVEALKALRAALLAERAFVDQLDWKGVHFGAPLLPAAIPVFADGCERINQWLTEFARGEGRYKLS